MVFYKLVYDVLLRLGVHIGHTRSNTLNFSAWMIVAFRKKIAIIDIFKSLTALRIALVLLTNVVFMRGPIWFLNLEPSFEFYVRRAALACGEFVVTQKWIRGVISNFLMVFNAFRRLSYFAPFVWSMKQRKYEAFFRRWYLMRLSWPRLVFISHAKTSYYAAKELADFKIPIMSIVDTDVHTQASFLPIPGNDESLGCMVFYHDLFSRFILRQKFSFLSRWFFHVRAGFRTVEFADWLGSKYKLNVSALLNDLILFEPKLTDALLKGTLMSLSFKKKFKIFSEKVLMRPLSSSKLLELFGYFVDAWGNLIMCISLDLLKRSWSFSPIFKDEVFSASYFKLRFLPRDYFWREFVTKKYLTFIEGEGVFSSKLLRSVVDLYFLYRYFSNLRLSGVDFLKLRYWRKLSSIIGLFYREDRKLVWRDFYPVEKEWIPQPEQAWGLGVTNWVLVTNVKFKETPLYVSKVHFDASLPSHFWYWNSMYFLPQSFNVDHLYSGYFFRRSFATNMIDGGLIIYRENVPNREVYWAEDCPNWVWF